jgi:hypothetical protein
VETIEELHEHGEDAISLDPEMLECYKKEHDYVFVPAGAVTVVS